MSTIMTDEALAAAVLAAREAQGLSTSALAERSGVSRAMIAKIERAEAQPTAALLGRLSGALGLTLSELIARAEHGRTSSLCGPTPTAATRAARCHLRRAGRWSSSR
jgi:transcriptional regulator with XRE-family HTH domain